MRLKKVTGTFLEYPRPSKTEYPRPSKTEYPKPSKTEYPRPSNKEYPRPSNTEYPRPSKTEIRGPLRQNIRGLLRQNNLTESFNHSDCGHPGCNPVTSTVSGKGVGIYVLYIEKLEWWVERLRTGKNVEQRDVRVLEVLSWWFPAGTDVQHNNTADVRIT